MCNLCCLWKISAVWQGARLPLGLGCFIYVMPNAADEAGIQLHSNNVEYWKEIKTNSDMGRRR